MKIHVKDVEVIMRSMMRIHKRHGLAVTKGAAGGGTTLHVVEN